MTAQVETTLAEQVEEALAEISADESVQEFLAEADAERETDSPLDVVTSRIGTGTAVETETAVETARPRSRSWRR